jgi:hypothetical protein
MTSNGSSLENRDQLLWRPVPLTTQHPATHQSVHQLRWPAAVTRSV